jgi:putative Holliday junction resolvase
VSTPNNILGVDYGSVRIGLAGSDPERKLAFPISAYRRRSRREDARFFRSLADAFGQVVVGLPVHLNGREGAKAREARAFGQWLGEITGLPVVFWDERFTSLEAEQLLLSAGLTSKRRKARRDKVAAQILLQSYLDAGCPPEQPVGPLEG